jgi:hypothetical protein
MSFSRFLGKANIERQNNVGQFLDVYLWGHHTTNSCAKISTSYPMS